MTRKLSIIEYFFILNITIIPLLLIIIGAVLWGIGNHIGMWIFITGLILPIIMLSLWYVMLEIYKNNP